MTREKNQPSYEAEHRKAAELAARVADLEARNEELEWKLSRIKNNPLWKASAPFRRGLHWVIRQRDRLAGCGGIKGFFRKLSSKRLELKARESYGTGSFPDEEEAARQREYAFPNPVRISILVPLYNTPENFLRQMLDSVMNQTYRNWELCLADGSDEAHAYVKDICLEYAGRSEGRILYKKLEKNEGISGNTNRCYAMATGEYIGLFDHDDILHPCVLFEYMKAINEKQADYIYCDETTFKGDNINHMLTMHFKPDFAPDNLRANNYICHFSVFSRELLQGTQLFRPEFDGSQDHDMILRLTDRARHIVHVPKLLYYWRSHAGSVASGIEAKTYAIEAARGAVADHLRKKGYKNFRITSTKAFETIFRIRYEVEGSPLISIVIANKDHAQDLKRCVTSIRQRSTYDNYEIIVVENNSATEEIRTYYAELLGGEYEPGGEPVQTSRDGSLSIVRYEGAFHYSRVNNLGVAYAKGEYILLLNNDTEVITANWLEELLMYAQRPDVGAVGAKLYYGNRTIQHAGVVLGLGAHRTAGHSHYGQSRQNLGYMGRLCYAQNVSAVTGACLMVKRFLFESVGGLDEELAISLNDVDLCLKLRARGLLNVFTPFAELYHYESISRGSDGEGEAARRYEREAEIFREKWRKELEAGDPYYNPNFSLDRSDFALRIQ